MKKLILENIKQRGAAVIEYVVILSFVCVVGWGFVGSDNGMTGSIGSIINSVERLLGMTGVVYVDPTKQPDFDHKGKTNLSGLTSSAATAGNWGWESLYTNDFTDQRYTECGSAFLTENGDRSDKASHYALELLDQMYTDGSFGGVDPMSWAFTEGYGAGNFKQSLNLYWSNSDWSSFPPGYQVPIIQMSKGADGNIKYYVAMANMGDNGSIGLWNEAAALKGTVTYINPNGGTTDIKCTQESAPTNYNGVATAAPNLANQNLAFTDYNKAQEAYYKLVAEKGITVNNSYKKSN